MGCYCVVSPDAALGRRLVEAHVAQQDLEVHLVDEQVEGEAQVVIDEHCLLLSIRLC